MKTYRIAILGCRARGTSGARAYHAHPRTEVVALCDLVPERLAELGDELGVAARYTDADRMLAEVKPDLVAVPTGTEFHYPLCLKVLEHGAHIDVEKPLCTSLEEADLLLARAAETGSRMAVHHQTRSGASMRAVRRAIAEGRIGDVRYLYASCKGYYGGYGLMNIGTHLINNLLGTSGHCRGVIASATTGGLPITPEDVVVTAGGMGTVIGERITAVLEFGRDVTASLVLHRYPKVDNVAYAIEIFGTEGRLFWKNRGVWWLPTPHAVPDGEHDRWQPLGLEQSPGWDPTSSADADDYGYVDEYVHALDEGRDHESSGAEARHVMEVMFGVLESAAYGRRIELPQTRRDHPLLRWRSEHGLPAPEPGPRPYAEWLAFEDSRISARRR